MSVVILKDKTEGAHWVHTMVPKLRRPCVVLLSGDLGAGKTQFVRWFLERLGADDVASPTFAIHHEYLTSGGVIDHVDLYRVTSDADLEASGFWDLFVQSQGLVFVEWADRLPEDVWPVSWDQVFIKIVKEDGDQRRVEVSLKPSAPKSRQEP